MNRAELKRVVTRDCTINPALAGRIAELVGFTPRWSRMDVIETAMVRLAWIILTTERERTSAVCQALLELVKLRKEGMI